VYLHVKGSLGIGERRWAMLNEAFLETRNMRSEQCDAGTQVNGSDALVQPVEAADSIPSSWVSAFDSTKEARYLAEVFARQRPTSCLADEGVSLKTYFVGQGLIQFVSVYRSWSQQQRVLSVPLDGNSIPEIDLYQLRAKTQLQNIPCPRDRVNPSVRHAHRLPALGRLSEPIGR